MKNTLSFFLDVAQLKILPRTGWVWRGVKDPETVAEHSFRLAFFVWVLGRDAHLNMRRAIAMAIIHDLCEAYAGDLTPHYGTPHHQKIKAFSQNREREELLKRWIRLPQKEKVRASKLRKSVEKKALLRLVRPLSPSLRQEIFGLWLDFENGLSQEGRFVKQLDKLEVLLQAIEYFGTGQNTFVTTWWEEAEELVEHPLLVQFLHDIQSQLYNKKRGQIKGTLQFLLDVGKLKRNSKAAWVIRKVKNPDSFANHSFMLSIMGWVFAKERMPNLRIERVLKMSLAYNICSVYAKNRTPYDSLLKKKGEKERRKILEKWVRYSLKEKRKFFTRESREKWKAFQKLTHSLTPKIRMEMESLWKECRENKTKEARFVNQMYVMELLFQALQYWEKDKKFPVKAWWEWAFEFSDHALNLEFMDELKKHFVASSRYS